MKQLTDNEFNFILEDLEKRGLSEMSIRLELADHIGCQIEQDESKDMSFEQLYKKLMDGLSPEIFPSLQNQILLSENLKFQAMKKTVYLLGIISTIFIVTGSLFMGLHLAGASVLLMLGTILVVMGFLPLFFYTSYKEQEGKKSLILPLGAFLSIALLIVGALFKVLHYPFAREILLIGQIILLAGFLPVYLVSVYRKSQETRSWTAYLLLVVLSGALIYMTSSTRISSMVINEYISVSAEAKQTKDYFVIQTDSLYKTLNLKHPIGDAKITLDQIKLKSQEIDQYLDEIKGRLLSSSGNSSEVNLKNADSERACYLVLQKKGQNIQIPQSVDKYMSLLMNSTNIIKSKKLIYFYLSDVNRFENLPLVIALARINELQRNIKLAEYEFLLGIQ